jgi:hypothetical protein
MKRLKGKTPAGFWRRAWEGWKHVAKKIGNFQARVILMILYFVVLAPLGFAFHWAVDPLGIKPNTTHAGWRSRPDDESSPMERAQQQF